jgi:hypothetical protein
MALYVCDPSSALKHGVMMHFADDLLVILARSSRTPYGHRHKARRCETSGQKNVDVIAGEPFVADFPERVWATAGLLREPRRAYTASPAPDRLRYAVTLYLVNVRAI